MECSGCCKEFDCDFLEASYCMKCDENLNFPLGDVLNDIRSFKTINKFVCCGKEQVASNLELYRTCSECGKLGKQHCFTAFTDLVEVINAAGHLIKKHNEELALERKRLEAIER